MDLTIGPGFFQISQTRCFYKGCGLGPCFTYGIGAAEANALAKL